MARKTDVQEVRKYLKDWLNTNFQNGLITADQLENTIHSFSSFLPQMVRALNHGGKATLQFDDEQLTIHLREGRELTHKFNFFQLDLPHKGNKPKKLRCFVGHRFKPSISNSLRFNLRHCLEPSNIELIWSGKDLNAVGFFDDILKLIEKSDFCIFDDRQAEKKPNVYIELGIAYALKKPFMFASYRNNKIEIPSDLQHIAHILYRNYDELSRRIYFNLSDFLKSTGLRK